MPLRDIRCSVGERTRTFTSTDGSLGPQPRSAHTGWYQAVPRSQQIQGGSRCSGRSRPVLYQPVPSVWAAEWLQSEVEVLAANGLLGGDSQRERADHPRTISGSDSVFESSSSSQAPNRLALGSFACRRITLSSSAVIDRTRGNKSWYRVLISSSWAGVSG